MKFGKILIALLVFPMVMEAADQGTSWWCSCVCGGGSEAVAETPEQAAARAERERIKEYFKTHPGNANFAIRGSSVDMDRDRRKTGKRLDSPTYVKTKERMRVARAAAIEVQAEQAGVAPEVWETVRGSTDARNRRPGQVYHAKDMVALQGGAVPKAPTIERTASMSVHQNPEDLEKPEHDTEKERHQPLVFTFADAPAPKQTDVPSRPTHEPHRSLLTVHDSVLRQLSSDSTPKFALGQLMTQRPKSARLSVGENPLPAAEQTDALKLQLPGQVVEADAQSA